VAPPPAPAAAPKTAAPGSAPFDFIDDKPPPAAASGNAAPGNGRLPPGPRTGRGAPGKRAKQRRAPEAAPKARKLTLEETLEILGAGDLAVDDGRGELLNDVSIAGAATTPPAQKPKAKPSRLGRLFERLSERIGN